MGTFMTEAQAKANAEQLAAYQRQQIEAQQRTAAQMAEPFPIREVGEEGYRSDLEILNAHPRHRTDKEHFRYQLLMYNRSRVRFELSDQQLLDSTPALQMFMSDADWSRRTTLKQKQKPLYG